MSEPRYARRFSLKYFDCKKFSITWRTHFEAWLEDFEALLSNLAIEHNFDRKMKILEHGLLQ